MEECLEDGRVLLETKSNEGSSTRQVVELSR